MGFSTLLEFKEHVQGTLEANEEVLDAYGETARPQLKTYLVETNHDKPDQTPFGSGWTRMAESGWYTTHDSSSNTDWVLDASQPRIWRLFSLSRAKHSDDQVNHWLNVSRGLDHCWLTRSYLRHWSHREGWRQRGVGIRFLDGLRAEDERGKFSLKAWYGAGERVKGLGRVLQEAEEQFAIHSTRWQKMSGGQPSMTAEIYSHGKVTINSALEVDDALHFSQELVIKYRNALNDATHRRANTLAPFEITFEQDIDLDAFAQRVSCAAAPMRLWLVETQRSRDDFRRYKGVDVHTWDRILLDVGPDYAYITIPGKGCVNAAPRLATLQGEDSGGKADLAHDGVSLFG